MSLKIERSPRVIERLDVEINNFKDNPICLPTLNVSIGGFAIQCSMEERIQLTPEGDFVDDEVPVDVNLHLYDQHGQKECISASCRIVYSRRIAQDKCQIGMNFIELLIEEQSKLLKFIENASKCNDVK
ncbi:MAG: hypothetical protein GQ583_05825 [Methyloprofundus sp.]|nr:hypothetical protein [Methyloprofundus sp.]